MHEALDYTIPRSSRAQRKGDDNEANSHVDLTVGGRIVASTWTQTMVLIVCSSSDADIQSEKQFTFTPTLFNFWLHQPPSCRSFDESDGIDVKAHAGITRHACAAFFFPHCQSGLATFRLSMYHAWQRVCCQNFCNLHMSELSGTVSLVYIFSYYVSPELWASEGGDKTRRSRSKLNVLQVCMHHNPASHHQLSLLHTLHLHTHDCPSYPPQPELLFAFGEVAHLPPVFLLILFFHCALQ